MKEHARIVRIGGKEAVLRTEPAAECTKCCSCSAAKQRRIVIPSVSVEGFAEGDRVVLSVEGGSMMNLYLLLYGLPLLVFSGVLIGLGLLGGSPLVIFAIGVIATAGAYTGVGYVLKRYPGLVPGLKVSPAE
jgi:positive regulator of sigma E activity